MLWLMGDGRPRRPARSVHLRDKRGGLHPVDESGDPAAPIKMGVVVVPGESSYANNTDHFAVNPRTGTTNYGWTPVQGPS